MTSLPFHHLGCGHSVYTLRSFSDYTQPGHDTSELLSVYRLQLEADYFRRDVLASFTPDERISGESHHLSIVPKNCFSKSFCRVSS